MNVLFLDQFGEIGGAQRALLSLLPALEQRGWRAYAMLPPGGPLAAELRARGAEVEEIVCGPYRSGRKRAGDFLRFASDMRSQARTIGGLLDRVAFDLVYANGPRLLPAAARAAGGRIPVLFHAHSRLHQGYARTLAGWAIRRAKASVAACSEHVAQPLRPYVSAGHLHVIPNGTADLNFRERSFGASAPWRIGLVGRIGHEKGQIEFLRAAALLAPEFPNFRFSVCGAPLFGAQKYYNEVRALARNLPVDFLGWREDIGGVFDELDLLVAPSKHEGMGRVLVEAFSAGVPVVAFPVGGIPEVVADGQTGFLTAGTSPEALAARIRDAVRSDPEALRAIVINARQAWERYYTLDAYRARITELMERLAQAGPAMSETAARQSRR